MDGAGVRVSWVLGCFFKANGKGVDYGFICGLFFLDRWPVFGWADDVLLGRFVEKKDPEERGSYLVNLPRPTPQK